MNSRLEEQESKWTCEYCTYENWPSSLKCTMCRGAKPLLGEDIYRLRDPSPQRSGSNVASGPVTHLSPTDSYNLSCQNVPLGKWSCAMCTYLNYQNTTRCVQCGNNKPTGLNQSIHSVASNLHEHLAPLRLGDPPPNSGSNHPPINLHPERYYNLQANLHPEKWSCLVCTYENWPKATKCVMCGNPKEKDRRDRTTNNMGIILPSPERDHSQRNLPSPPHAPYIHQNQRDENLAVGRRFQREDILATLLSQIEGSGSGVKRVPSYVAPDLAAQIRRHVTNSIRLRKGSFPCYFVTDIATFALPAEVEDLPSIVQEQMLEELLDKEAQQQLEGGGGEPPALNWSLEITERLGSRLHALWNRSAGDCLLDSAMQATWGVFDRDNALRRALADTLQQAGQFFYPRWREYEASQASRMLDFTLEETQWQEDWESLLATAAQPGSALEQLHVFALAHILRRPIIVYGVKYVKSFRGEDIGYARFEGVYLPLLWEPSFCIRSPIALGYTRGHFTALVPIEPYTSSRIPPLSSHGGVGLGGGNGPLQQLQIQMQTTFMPLMDREHKLLPIHFLSLEEVGREESILKEWLDVCRTEGGVLVAQQKLHKRPLLVAQMLEEWLNHYRRLAQTNNAPFLRPAVLQDYSSDGDTEDE
ncbi:ubiquitin thioesterase trabid isoform X2 [Bombus pyrosoma]|uniref:ubiquitin thioesterase trabid isoform X2 n=1 Tax=Bombus pyrosoma TaxID=396416 RepID=UPI001CB99D07|nr:ubiquitin thioesterase trabid isoform X2 [Bombus pyrosoma]